MRRHSHAPPPRGILYEALRMHDQLEGWCDAHPQASFGEIEAEGRQQRRELPGKCWRNW